MKKKIFSILMAVVLVFSLGAVFSPAPTAAMDGVTVNIIECPEGIITPCTNFGVKAEIVNGTGGIAHNVIASIEIFGPAVLIPEMPDQWDLGTMDVGQTDEVGWTLHCEEPGDVDIRVYTNTGGEDWCLVEQEEPAKLDVTVYSPCEVCTNCSPDNQFTVTADIENVGDVDAHLVQASLAMSGPGTAIITSVTVVNVGTIPAGTTNTMASWDVTCTGDGDITFTVTATGSDVALVTGSSITHQRDVIIQVVDVCGLSEIPNGCDPCSVPGPDPRPVVPDVGDTVSTQQKFEVTAQVNNCSNIQMPMDITLTLPPGTMLSMEDDVHIEHEVGGVFDIAPVLTVHVDPVCGCCWVRITWTLVCTESSDGVKLPIVVTAKSIGQWLDDNTDCQTAWVIQEEKVHLTPTLTAHVFDCGVDTEVNAVAVSQDFDVKITVENSGEAVAENVVLWLDVAGDGSATCTDDDLEIDFGDIAGDQTVVKWLNDYVKTDDCHCLNEGQITISVDATKRITGEDENTCDPILEENIDWVCFLILDQVPFTVKIIQPEMCCDIPACTNFTVKATLTNESLTRDIYDVNVTLNWTGGSRASLAPGQAQTINIPVIGHAADAETPTVHEVTWQMRCNSPGDVTFHVCAESTDPHLQVQDSNVPFTLEAYSGCTAEWTSDEQHTGCSSVKLYNPAGEVDDNYAEVAFDLPCMIKLSEIDMDATSFFCKTSSAWTPYFMFELESGDRINTDAFAGAGYADWAEYVASSTPQWQYGSDSSWHDWPEVLTDYGNEIVEIVLVELSGLPSGAYTAYVDDITINGEAIYPIVTIHQIGPPPADVTVEILSPALQGTLVATSQDFAVTAVITNNETYATVTITGAEVDIDPWLSPEEEIRARVTKGPTPALPWVLEAGESVTATWTLHCEKSGHTMISVEVWGGDEVCKDAHAYSEPVIVIQYPAAHLEVQNIHVTKSTVTVSENFTVTADIVNTGEADAWEVSATLSVAPDGSARVVAGDYGYTQFIGTIPGHGSENNSIPVEWTLHCKEACESTITITAEGFDEYGWHKKQECQSTGTFLIEPWEEYGGGVCKWAWCDSNSGYEAFFFEFQGVPTGLIGPFNLEAEIAFNAGDMLCCSGRISMMGIITTDGQMLGVGLAKDMKPCVYLDPPPPIPCVFDGYIDVYGGLFNIVNGTFEGTFVGDFYSNMDGGMPILVALTNGTYCSTMASTPGEPIFDRFIEDASITVKQEAAPIPVDIAVTKAVDNDRPLVGDEATFTITATNNGPGVATDVELTDLLSAGTLTFVSASKGTYSAGVWTVGDLASGMSATLTLMTTVGIADPITNEASVTAVDQTDWNSFNDSASVILNPAAVTSKDVNLVDGWNLISMPLMPNNTAIGTVFAGIVGNISTTEGASTYPYATDGTATWSSNVPPDWDFGLLTVVRDGPGYWLVMTATDVLTVNGIEMPVGQNVPPSYEVYPGWNMIGFKSVTAKTASDYLAAVAGKYTVIYRYTNGVYSAVQASDSMRPGEGFWIAITLQGTIFP